MIWFKLSVVFFLTALLMSLYMRAVMAMEKLKLLHTPWWLDIVALVINIVSTIAAVICLIAGVIAWI